MTSLSQERYYSLVHIYNLLSRKINRLVKCAGEQSITPASWQFKNQQCKACIYAWPDRETHHMYINIEI